MEEFEFKVDVNGLNPDDFNDEIKAKKERRRVWVGTYCPGYSRTDVTRGKL